MAAQGLGRAVVCFQQNDIPAYRDAVLQACLHDLTFDSQLEEPRGEYLWMLIESAGRPFFRDALFGALTSPAAKTSGYDWPQIFSLARHFASENDQEMRGGMYTAFNRLGFKAAGLPSAISLLDLDGLDGFMFAVSRYAPSSSEDDWWIVESLITNLEERIGKQEAEEAIAVNRGSDPAFASVLNSYSDYEQKQRRERASSPDDEGGWDVLKSKSADRAWAWQFRRWALRASDEERSAALDELLTGTDPTKVWAALRVLSRRPSVAHVDQVLALSDSGDELVRRAAVIALSRLKHPRVRARALELARSPDRVTDGVTLLESNCEAGDGRILEDMLAQSLTEDQIHRIQLSVRTIVGNGSRTELESVLLFLYENGPCSLCRTSVVAGLMEIGLLPEGIRNECRFDADPSTRRLGQTNE